MVDPSNLLILSAEVTALDKWKGCQAIFTRDVSAKHFWWLRDESYTISKVLLQTYTKSSSHLCASGNVEVLRRPRVTGVSVLDFPLHKKLAKLRSKGHKISTNTYCLRIQFMSVLRQNFIHAGLVNICDKTKSPTGKKVKHTKILEQSMDSLWSCKTELRKINKQMAAVCWERSCDRALMSARLPPSPRSLRNRIPHHHTLLHLSEFTKVFLQSLCGER